MGWEAEGKEPNESHFNLSPLLLLLRETTNIEMYLFTAHLTKGECVANQISGAEPASNSLFLAASGALGGEGKGRKRMRRLTVAMNFPRPTLLFVPMCLCITSQKGGGGGGGEGELLGREVI